MNFEIGKKYNKQKDAQINPYVAIGTRTNGRRVFENANGSVVDYSDEYFQEHFTPALQYPPCSLEDARVGDTVECWCGEKEKVENIDNAEVQCENVTYQKDGRHILNDKHNAKALHKQPKGIEPLELPEVARPVSLPPRTHCLDLAQQMFKGLNATDIHFENAMEYLYCEVVSPDDGRKYVVKIYPPKD